MKTLTAKTSLFEKLIPFVGLILLIVMISVCLLYTSDAADERG